MKRHVAVLLVVVGLMSTLLAVPAAADAPIELTFPTVNDENAIDPCTGDPMVVEITATLTIHQHERSAIVHAKASGTSGDYTMLHSNLINVVTANKVEARLVEFYEGPDGSRMRVAIRSTFLEDSQPSFTFTAQCLVEATGA